MRKLFTLFLLFTALSLQLTAQSVTVYDAFNATKTIDPKKSKGSSTNNNLQWNYSLLARGAFAFTYERRINDYLGAEIGAGPTLFYDFTNYIFSSDFMDSFDNGEKNSYSPGIFLSATAKVYPKQMNDFEGFYMAPTFRYRTYNYKSTFSNWDYDSHEDIEYSRKRSLKTTDVAFVVGYQWESWWEIMFSSYFGFGWTMKSYDKIDYDNPAKPTKKVTDSGPLFLIGASVGFTF